MTFFCNILGSFFNYNVINFTCDFSSTAVLWQLMHSHPTEQSLPFLLQPQRPVVQPVIHLQPLSNALILLRTANTFSSMSHCIMSSPLLVTCHPCSVIGASVMTLKSACFHMCITQQDRIQCSIRATFEGIISFSNRTLSHIVCHISSSHAAWCCCSVNPEPQCLANELLEMGFQTS